MTSYEVYKKIFNDKQESLLWAQGKIEGSVPPPLIRSSFLSKSVDEIIQTLNVINRPLWMPNPYWAWAAQLKGFMFAFGKNVGGRFYREVVEPLFRGRIPVEEASNALALTLIMAASMAIREGKDELRYADEDSPHKNLNTKDRMLQAFIASNISFWTWNCVI